MKKGWIMTVCLLGLVAGLMAQATDLLISEYVEGTSYQKAIELFNGTGATVDLSQYSLKKQTNGAGAWGSELILSGTLANNDVYVIVNSTSGGTNLVGQPYVDLATTSQCINFNGNDAVALFHNGVQTDVVGIYNDPSNWGLDLTLVRNANIYMPSTTFNLGDWTQYPVNTFTYLGSHTFTGGTTTPTIIVNSPNGGEEWFVGQTYAIGWASANITGNVQIELDNNGNLSTLAASVENTGSWSWTIPATQSVGTQYKIKVSAVDNSASDMSNSFFAISQIVVVQVANLGQLRSQTADGTTHYQLTGEAILTYQQTYRHKKYIQDGTGAIEIDDPNGIITSVYQIGDGITGLIGTLSDYHSLLQFIPVFDAGQATSSGNVIVPEIVTINQLNTNYAAYQCELVLIDNATFMDTSAPFASGTAYQVSDPTGQITFRTNFYDADYLGQPIPTGAISMRVICYQYDTTYQITARGLADFSTVSIEPNDVPDPVCRLLGNSPNPFTTETAISYSLKSAQPVSIDIYNLKGQLVRRLFAPEGKAGENRLVWDGTDSGNKLVPTGVYLYRMHTADDSGSLPARKMLLTR